MFEIGQCMQLPGNGGVGWIEEIRQGEDGELAYRMQFGTKWWSHKELADHKAKGEASWRENTGNHPLVSSPRRGRIVRQRLGRQDRLGW